MSPKTYVVSSTDEFHAILKTAKGGDTIKLNSGDYEGVDIRGVHFDNPVTITSVDPDDPAVLMHSTLIKNSSNITLSNLELTPDAPDSNLPNSSSKAALFIWGSENIKLVDSFVHAHTIEGDQIDESRDLLEGYPYGFGIRISGSKDISLQGNEITQLHKGIGLWNTENVEISNNHLHHIRIDGIVGTDQRDTLIEQNLFNNFIPYRKDVENPNGYTDDHSDMIQYWGATSKSGIDGFVVRDNVFIQAEGAGNQTIFGRLNLRDDDDADAIAFKNFEISGNLIYNGKKNAIVLGDVSDAKVFNNSLIATKTIEEDFRNIPQIGITYDGNSSPTDDDFSLTAQDVQKARDIEVYDNVLTYAFDPEIRVEAFNKKHNTMDEVKAALGIDVNGNSWINSKLTVGETYSKVSQITAEIDARQTLNISLNAQTDQLYGDKGSVYYTDANALQGFLDKLNTSSKIVLETTSEPIQKGKVSAPDAESPASNDLIAEKAEILQEKVETQVEEDEQDIIILMGRPDDYDIRVVGNKSINIRNLETREFDKVDVSDGIYFQGADALYMIDAQTGETVYVKPWTQKELYKELRAQKIEESAPNVEDSDPSLTVTGSNSNDILIGTSENDHINGLGGSDLLRGKGGDDLMIGGYGRDRLLGDSGDDVLLGGGGKDVLIGNRGDDLLLGGTGRDFIAGAMGRDILVGGAGNDRILGGSNIDTVVYGGSEDDYEITRIEPQHYSVKDLKTKETDIIIDVERIYFAEDGLLGEIRYGGWVKELNKKTFAEDYAKLDPDDWFASYSDEMVY